MRRWRVPALVALPACLFLSLSVATAGQKDHPRARAKVALAAKDADVHGLARLFGELTKQNMVVPGTVEGRVSLRSVRAPWDQVLGMALEEVGCDWRRHGSFLVVGKPEELKASLKALRRQRRSAGIPVGTRITLDFVRADLVNLLVLFSDIQRVEILAEKGLAAKVSVQARNARWRYALEATLLACGMGMKKEGASIRVGRFASLAGDASGFAPVEKAPGEPDLPGAEPDPLVYTSPAERYELGGLRLTAVVSGIRAPRVLVETADGTCFVLRRGDRAGKQHARVVEVQPEALLLEETFIDAAGAKAGKRYRMALGGLAVDLSRKK